MHQLLLLRHAKSSWDDASLSDHARPLNARGHDAAAAICREMRELGLAPDVVLVSTARRTLQTLEALEPWDELPIVEATDALYLATAPQMLGLLRHVAETVRSVLLIAHNPGLHDLAIMLAGQAANKGRSGAMQRLASAYPTGALAEFSVPGAWQKLGAGSARLVRFITPRDLSPA